MILKTFGVSLIWRAQIQSLIKKMLTHWYWVSGQTCTIKHFHKINGNLIQICNKSLPGWQKLKPYEEIIMMIEMRTTKPNNDDNTAIKQ